MEYKDTNASYLNTRLKKSQWQKQGMASVKWWSQRACIHYFSQSHSVKASVQSGTRYALVCFIVSWKISLRRGGGIHKTMGKHFWDGKLQIAGHPTEGDTLGLRTIFNKATSF